MRIYIYIYICLAAWPPCCPAARLSCCARLRQAGPVPSNVGIARLWREEPRDPRASWTHACPLAVRRSTDLSHPPPRSAHATSAPGCLPRGTTTMASQSTRPAHETRVHSASLRATPPTRLPNPPPTRRLPTFMPTRSGSAGASPEAGGLGGH